MNSISMKLIKTIEERIMHSCNIFLLITEGQVSYTAIAFSNVRLKFNFRLACTT